MKEDLSSTIEEDVSGKKNDKALAIIKLLCEDGPLLQIKDIARAKEAWIRLQDLYNPKGFTTENLNLKDFFNTTLDDFQSMEEYQVIIALVLNSLGNEYEGFISNITQALRNDSKAYTIKSLFSSLADEARGRKNGHNNSHRLLYIKAKGKSYKRQAFGRYCQHCKLTSHVTSNCYFLFPNKAPKGWKKGNKNNKMNQKDIKVQKNQKNQNRPKDKDALAAVLSSLDPDVLYDSSNMNPHSNPQSNINSNHDSSNSHEYDHLDQDMTENPEIYTMDLDPLLNMNDIPDDQLFDIASDEVCLPLITPNTRAVTNINNSELDQLVTKEHLFDRESKVDFIIDSAATINTIHRMDYFFRYKEINKIISWGKAKSLKAKYQGDILIKYPSGYINIIKDVYYIPELGINLISVDRISEALGITTIFTKDKVSLYKNNQSIIAGYKNNSLYHILFTILYPKEHINACLNNSEPSEFCKWHMRLGHINAIPLGMLLSTMGIAISSHRVSRLEA
jgi:hypothetical protein